MIFRIFMFLSLVSQAQDFVWLSVGLGEKPQMTLINDVPTISYFKEDATNGYLSLATYDNVKGTFDHDLILNGNFYGPAFSDVYNDEPYFVFHDHGLNGGGANVVFSDGLSWSGEDASDAGHDGWDTDIKVLGENEIYVSYIDAIPFSGLGLEFSEFDGLNWTIDTVGTTLLEYGFGSSLELKADKTPMVFYYNSTNDALELAYKDNSTWRIENLDSTGSPGYFPVTTLINDTVYVAYYNRIGNYKAELKLGKLTPNRSWSSEVLDTLNDVIFTYKGRHPIDIQINSGLTIIASDTKQIKKYDVSLGLSLLNKKLLFNDLSPDTTLMQTLSYKLDDLGYEHIVFSYKTNNEEYMYYGANTPGISIPEVPTKSELVLYPNPVNESFKLNQTGIITIYNNLGVLVRQETIKIGENVNVSSLPSGLYFLRIGHQNLSFVIE